MEETRSSRFISSCALLLSLIMLTSLFAPIAFVGPATALTSGDYDYELTNGNTEVVLKKYHGPGGEVSVPAEIEGKPVVWIDYRTFDGIHDLTAVTIPAYVFSIGPSSFWDCPNLTSLYVNESNTHFESVDGVLFSDSLEMLWVFPLGRSGPYVVPDTTTSIGYEAFGYCSKLTSVTVPDSVTAIHQKAFYSCTALDSVSLGSGISEIYPWSFAYCSALGSVAIPDSVITIGNSAFISCGSLSSVTFGSGVTSIGNNAFYYCGSITALNIPGNVQTIGGSAFSGLTSLTSLTLNEGLVTIGDYAFISCVSLVTVDIPGSVTSLGDTSFANCRSMTAIEVDPANTVYESVGGILYNEAMTKLIKFPNGMSGNFTVPDDVTSLGSRAFNSCQKLNRVQIGEDLVDIPMFAIAYSANLTAIEVDDGNPVFSSVDGVLFDKDVTELIQYPCGKGGDYIFPSTVVTIGDWSMDYAQELISITIPEGVVHIGEGAFSESPMLITVSIPASVTFIGEWAFDDCDALEEINVADGNLNYSSMDGVLFNDNGTVLIRFPGGLGGTYVVPDGVTTIDSWAINQAPSLTSIVLPDSLTYLGYYCLSNVPALTSIIFKGDAPDHDDNWLHSVSENLVIYHFKGATGFASLTWLNVLYVELSEPSAPVLASATAGETYVVLAWTAPIENGNSTIIGYKVYYGNATPDVQFGEMLSNTTLSVTVTGLEEGTRYFFAVTAVNEVGDSESSNVLNATTEMSSGTDGGSTLLIVVALVIVAALAAVAIWWFRFKK